MEFKYVGKGLYFILNSNTLQFFGLYKSMQEAENAKEFICSAVGEKDKDNIDVLDIDDYWEQSKMEVFKEFSLPNEAIGMIGGLLVKSKKELDDSLNGIVCGNAIMWYIKMKGEFAKLRDSFLAAFASALKAAFASALKREGIKFEQIEHMAEEEVMVVIFGNVKNTDAKYGCAVFVNDVNLASSYLACEEDGKGTEFIEHWAKKSAKEIKKQMIEKGLCRFISDSVEVENFDKNKMS